MCEYCGCQEIDVIGELTSEHDRLRDLGRSLSAAADAGDLAEARRLAHEMRCLLGPHTEVEENALFPLLAADFGSPLDALVVEHRSIDAALALPERAQPPASWPADVRHAVADLFEHILKEQDGVFPAALANLTGTQWEAVAAARALVHAPVPTP